MLLKNRYEIDLSSKMKGGFATVYKAWDKDHHLDVAVKLFSGNTGDKGSVIAEIRKAIRLNHPNLVRYFDSAILERENEFGEQVTSEVGIMEYIDGGTVKEYLAKNPGSLMTLTKGILEGLGYLHEEGLIHRDIKPGNILVKETKTGPVAKITDFGISKELGSGAQQSATNLMGSINYMAPEQFSPRKYGIDGKLSYNVDLWAFGVMLYELVSGQLLFGTSESDTTQEEVMQEILQDDKSDRIAALPAPYADVVKACLIKSAADRAQTAYELLALLTGKAYEAPKAPAPSPNVVPGQTVVIESRPIAPPTEIISAKVNEPSEPATQVIDSSKIDKGVASERVKTGPVATDAPKRKGTPLAVWVVLAVLLGGAAFLIADPAGWFNENSTASVTPADSTKTTDSTLNQGVTNETTDTTATVPSLDSTAPSTNPNPQVLPPDGKVKSSEIPAWVIEKIKTGMVYVAGGSMAIGCTSDQGDCDEDDFPIRTVYVGNMYMSKCEITQAMWQAVMGNNPSNFDGCPNCPVESVNYNDVLAFISKVNAASGLNFRLPTEAEWEYAARGGKRSEQNQFSGSDGCGYVAWYKNNSSDKTHPVMSGKEANELGLFDMSGNVWEWTSTTVSGDKVIKGGSYDSEKEKCRVSHRLLLSPADRVVDCGFRLVRN